MEHNAPSFFNLNINIAGIKKKRLHSHTGLNLNFVLKVEKYIDWITSNVQKKIYYIK